MRSGAVRSEQRICDHESWTGPSIKHEFDRRSFCLSGRCTVIIRSFLSIFGFTGGDRATANSEEIAYA